MRKMALPYSEILRFVGPLNQKVNVDDIVLAFDK